MADDKILMQIVRKEGGEVDIKADDSMQLVEMAAAMMALSDLAKMRGWHPGQVARAYSDLEMRVTNPMAQRLGVAS